MRCGCTRVVVKPAVRDPNSFFDAAAAAWLSANAGAHARGTKLLALEPNLVHATRKWPVLAGLLDGLNNERIGHWRASISSPPFELHAIREEGGVT